jgi:hypothetical protein
MAIGKRTGGGNRKGVPNKVTKELKDMILGALDDAGGQVYLARQADENPAAFLALLGKVLPKNIEATHIINQLSDAELDAKIAALNEQLNVR